MRKQSFESRPTPKPLERDIQRAILDYCAAERIFVRRRNVAGKQRLSGGYYVNLGTKGMSDLWLIVKGHHVECELHWTYRCRQCLFPPLKSSSCALQIHSHQKPQNLIHCHCRHYWKSRQVVAKVLDIAQQSAAFHETSYQNMMMRYYDEIRTIQCG